MGKSLKNILHKIGMDEIQFKNTCEKFTNKKIFRTDQSGKLIYDDNNSLIKINYDNH